MKPKHWFVFILLGAIWSSSFLWIKIAVQEIGPITLVAFRVLFGLLFSLVVILIRRTKIPRDFKSWVPFLILGISNVAIPFFLISWGEQAIDSGVAAILDATVPLFTIVVAHYLLHDDKMTWPKVIGLLMGFAGVIVLMSKDIGGSPGSVFGQIAVVVASMFYAGSSVYARKSTQEASGLIRGAGPLVSSTAVMWVAALTVEQPFKIPQIPITWIALLWLGVLGSGFAFILNYYLIHEIGPTRTTMVTYIFPLGGVILGVLFLNEQLSWQLLAGAVLIVASLAVANRNPQKTND
ncbi:MAG: DMT family transporter [Chloroflexi bacterium]|nr:DMT family transporter [Chloroflexota bacterium]MBI3338951.1 DMT family transporter [Chloroflexota bacterium]